jgi:hypothetical protein
MCIHTVKRKERIAAFNRARKLAKLLDPKNKSRGKKKVFARIYKVVMSGSSKHGAISIVETKKSANGKKSSTKRLEIRPIRRIGKGIKGSLAPTPTQQANIDLQEHLLGGPGDPRAFGP